MHRRNLDKKMDQYIIPGILPVEESKLEKDIYLVFLHATRIPPHLAISVCGKIVSLSVKGAHVDGELKTLLKLIHQHKIGTLFIKLSVPEVFTTQHLYDEIKKYTLLYPRVDYGIATCLSPIKDFCSEIYKTNFQKINFVYDLLPELIKQNAIGSVTQINLNSFLIGNSFYLSKYTMNDIYEGIRFATSNYV